MTRTLLDWFAQMSAKVDDEVACVVMCKKEEEKRFQCAYIICIAACDLKREERELGEVGSRRNHTY